MPEKNPKPLGPRTAADVKRRVAEILAEQEQTVSRPLGPAPEGQTLGGLFETDPTYWPGIMPRLAKTGRRR